MSTSSQNSEALSRQYESMLLNSLAAVGQVNVANALNVDQSTISKWKGSEYFKDVAALLAALNLKPVPTSHQVEDPIEIDALRTLARKYLVAASIRPRTELLAPPPKPSLWKKIKCWIRWVRG